MKSVKSERLKKLEAELKDLEQWLKLGLVPKKDITKHEEEIRMVEAKVEEELERIQFLKDSGDEEDYVAPKRAATRASYTEMATLPDVDMTEGPGLTTGGSFNQATEEEKTRVDTKETPEEEEAEEDTFNPFEDTEGNEEGESYFSDRNRWKRGGNMIVDPDADVL